MRSNRKSYGSASAAAIWAKNHNWLLLRLRGALSTFSHDNEIMLKTVVGRQHEREVDAVTEGLRSLIGSLSGVDTYEKHQKLVEERRKADES